MAHHESTISVGDPSRHDPERYNCMSISRNPAVASLSSSSSSLGRSSSVAGAVIERPMLVTSDISGARPRNRYDHVREIFHGTGDVEGAASRTLHGAKSGHFGISVDDISGAKPHADTFRSQRVTDPLDPKYALPQSAPQPPILLPFKRDLHGVGDIEGTRSRLPSTAFATREMLHLDVSRKVR